MVRTRVCDNNLNDDLLPACNTCVRQNQLEGEGGVTTAPMSHPSSQPFTLDWTRGVLYLLHCTARCTDDKVKLM